MWPFRRRRRPAELGAAVTGIPRMPSVKVVPAPYEAPAPVSAVPVEAPVAPAPRVELGFRDGSTAALAPESAQAKALTEIASVLTQRD